MVGKESKEEVKEYTPTIAGEPESNEEILARALRMLLNKVNVVTSTHRAGFCDPSGENLTQLANRQVEVEEMLRAAGIEV